MDEQLLKILTEKIEACKPKNECLVMVPNMGRLDVYQIDWNTVQLAMKLNALKDDREKPYPKE